jgi:DNA polymerase V
MYALIDCNNFYASCERVFNYGLRGKPIAILSNNDGCVIARSEEAKKAGVTMGGPAFKLRDVFEDYDVAVLSSNYALYGDMSRRVMEVLHELTASVEPYSIDEAFVKLSVNNNKNWTQQGRHIKDTVGKWTGIPVSVGIAPSKTWPNLPMKRPKPNLNMKGYYHSPKTCKLMNY